MKESPNPSTLLWGKLDQDCSTLVWGKLDQNCSTTSGALFTIPRLGCQGSSEQLMRP